MKVENLSAVDSHSTSQLIVAARREQDKKA